MTLKMLALACLSLFLRCVGGSLGGLPLISVNDLGRIERYSYDGVRRVQELVCTAGCDSGPTFTTLREYVHGPEYVDQFLLQINQPGAMTPVVSYTLQDDNYNVVALTNASGVIIRQHALDPYGNLIARDDFPAFGQTTVPATRLGHQGLTVDRLDAPWDVDLVVAGSSTGHPGGSTASPDATPRLIYLNRNRIYDPLFARFSQRDPNATGLMLTADMAANGTGFGAPARIINIPVAYGDGLNLFGYCGSTPVDHRDPAGLFSLGDVMGSAAVRGTLTGLEVYDAIGKVVNVFTAIAGGMDWRNALIDVAISAAFDRLQGKAFEAAIDGAVVGFRAINNALTKGGVTELGMEAASRGYRRSGVGLDANILVRALDDGEIAAVDAALRGRYPIISITAAKEYLVKGDVSKLREFLVTRGGRIGAAGTEAAVRNLQEQAQILGRRVKLKDGRVAAGAIAEGVPLLTGDRQLYSFLREVGLPAELY